MKHLLLGITFVISTAYQNNCLAAIVKWSSTLPVSSVFVVNQELNERVDFWKKIYSVYTTKQGVFHLPNDPDFILGEIDLTNIYNNSVYSDSQKRRVAQKEINKKREELAVKWKISDSSRIRLQMGLKDRMQKALFLSGRYLPMMEKVFKKNGLPVELTRIVFVESSFNVLAQSKVGASGLWQIMPQVARPQGYITSDFDKRNHPLYATQLAASILKQNYKTLKSWPLAITAYNHGVSGILRMQDRAHSDQIQDLINYDSPTKSWGFASRNFYACFLAVLEVEKNAISLFGQDLVQLRAQEDKEYLLSESVSKRKILQWYNGSMTRFRQMNPHLNWSKINKSKKIPAGIPIQIPQENYHLTYNQKT